MNDSDSQLDNLLASLCDGTISQADFTVLETRLAADPQARRRYVQMMDLHAELAWSDGSLAAAREQEELEGAIALAGTTSDSEKTNQSTTLGRIHRATKAALLALVPGLALVWAYSAGWFSASDTQTIATFKPGSDAKLTAESPRNNKLLIGSTIELQAGTAGITFKAGSQLMMTGTTTLRVNSNNSATLLGGMIEAHVPQQAVGFTLDAPGFRVIDLGTRFSVFAAADGSGVVRVHEGRVDVVPDLRLPRLFLDFDDAAYPADPLSNLRGQPEGSVTRVLGIIGNGALQFTNHDSQKVMLGVGGSDQIGRGIFGVRDGITIEVLIIPRWTGKGWTHRTPQNPLGLPYDYDQIFRKEDGEHRVLLSFQDDRGAEQPIAPVVDPGPCLTFGLHLEGLGYSELDMPLDGQAGRPTLAQLQDGKIHHVVATYDAASGIKAIYIDGTVRFRHRFPAGSRILAGGGGHATVGNSPSADEAFNGVIDEFAFYDVALTPAEISGHWRNIQAGRSYFGDARFKRQADGRVAAMVPMSAGEAMKIDAHSRLPVAIDSATSVRE